MQKTGKLLRSYQPPLAAIGSGDERIGYAVVEGLVDISYIKIFNPDSAGRTISFFLSQKDEPTYGDDELLEAVTVAADTSAEFLTDKITLRLAPGDKLCITSSVVGPYVHIFGLVAA